MFRFCDIIRFNVKQINLNPCSEQMLYMAEWLVEFISSQKGTIKNIHNILIYDGIVYIKFITLLFDLKTRNIDNNKYFSIYLHEIRKVFNS